MADLAPVSLLLLGHFPLRVPHGRFGRHLRSIHCLEAAGPHLFAVPEMDCLALRQIEPRQTRSNSIALHQSTLGYQRVPRMKSAKER